MIRASFPRFLRGSTSGVWRRRLGNMPSTMALCSSSSNNTNDLMLGVRWCSYGKKRVVVEDRVAQWFRRLWALSHKEMSASATSSASSPLVEHAQEVMAMAETKGAAAVAASQHELLRDLKANVAHEQGGRLPVVLVDAVWEVFDAILPRSVQKDLANTMQPQHLTNFFSFIRLLGELDVDLPAVELASKTLAEELERYHRAKDELEEAVKGASSSSALPTDAEMHRRHDLAQAVDKSKAKIIRCCFNTRTAGSPLYFTWIRHSASRENGIRRLMNFRKTVHFFDIECKKRISALRSQLTARALASAEVVNGTNTTTSNNNNNNNKTNDEVQRELVSETDFWVGRQRDVAQIDAALSFLFHDFFSKEFLVMEELTWFSTPPAMLEQIMAAESVHPFQHGLADMKERLQPTHHRHLFAFLHPSVVEEPLIAVQVALTRGISSSVDAILHRPTPLADARNRGATAQTFQLHAEACGGEDGPTNEAVDTAIFYSINSAQSALRGMDMGNLLIKRVVREIEENINTSRRTRHLTAIDQFSTLSPIPGFTRWLSAEVEKLNQCATREDGGQCLACVQSIFGAWGAEELEERCLAPLREAVLSYAARGTVDGGDDDHEGLCIARLQAALASGSMAVANAQCLKFLLRLFLAPDVRRPWWNDHIFTATLELPLLTTVAHYLCEEKKRRRILDPVGNFHVSNGAMIFRLNFLANTTAQGSRESACVMVNYRYVPHNISNNASNYSTTQSVELGETVKLLLHTSSSSSSS